MGHCGAFCGLLYILAHQILVWLLRLFSCHFFKIFIFSVSFKVTMIVIEFMYLGRNMFWGLLRAHFYRRLAARAKKSLRRAQNIFIPANINPIVLLFEFSIFIKTSSYKISRVTTRKPKQKKKEEDHGLTRKDVNTIKRKANIRKFKFSSGGQNISWINAKSKTFFKPEVSTTLKTRLKVAKADVRRSKKCYFQL